MIVFEKITIEAFGSIQGPFVYHFDSPGINLILGKNGVGKTTILNAFAWCLYKQVLKKGSSIEPWKHTQGKKYRGTMVSVNFRDGEDSYQVTRCKDFKGNVGKPNQRGGSKLFFFKNGELTDRKYKSNIQPQIEKAIGYSFNLFKNGILFGQEVERLMKESGPNKRKVFEEAFDTSFIEVAKEKVEKRYKERKLVQDKYESLVDRYESELSIFDNTTNDMVKLITKNISNLNRERDELVAWIKKAEKKKGDKKIEKKQNRVKKKIKEIEGKLDSKVKDEEFRLSMWINGKQTQIDTLRDKIQINKDLFREGFKCPECKRPLPKKEVRKNKDKIKSIISSLKKSLEQEIKEKEKMEEDYSKVKELLGKQSFYIEQLRAWQKILRSNEAARDEFIGTKALLKNKKDKDLPALEKNIQNLKKEQLVLENKRAKQKSEIQNKLKEAEENYNHYKNKSELDEWLIKDPLSNKGLRAYIFDAMLQDLNDCLKQYRVFINFSIRVYVELETARKDIKIAIIKKGEEVPYEDLSKGQKQLTDAILAFAINDTITKNKPINIFLMDEVFESLSIDNVEIISNIVMQKANKYSIHMITHLTSFQPRGIKKTILQLDKQGNTVKAA